MDKIMGLYEEAKEQLDMIEEMFYEACEGCDYRKLMESTGYDRQDWYSCTNKLHRFSNAIVSVCSLEYCPL